MSTLKKLGVLGLMLLLVSSVYFMYGETKNVIKETQTESFSGRLDLYEIESVFPNINIWNDFKETNTVQQSKKIRSLDLFLPMIEEHTYEITEISRVEYSVKNIDVQRDVSFPSLVFMLGICLLAFVSGNVSDSKSFNKPVSSAILLLVTVSTLLLVISFGSLPQSRIEDFSIWVAVSIFTIMVGIVPLTAIGKKYYYIIFFVAGIFTQGITLIYLFNYTDNYLINETVIFPVQELILFFGVLILIEQFPTLKEKFKNLKTLNKITA